MTKKDFIKIANVLCDLKPSTGDNISNEQYNRLCVWRDTVDAFSTMCATTNSRFKRDLFVKACGMEQ